MGKRLTEPVSPETPRCGILVAQFTVCGAGVCLKTTCLGLWLTAQRTNSNYGLSFNSAAWCGPLGDMT